MRYIVGLGNPGSDYEHTRHNAGFLLIDEIRRQLEASGTSLRREVKGLAETYQGGEYLLIKPQGYMNTSGEVVRDALMYRDRELAKGLSGRELSTLWVAHDDLDLELGNYKIMLGKGPKIHNGLLSLYEQLGTQQFWHVRLGIDGRAGDRTIPAKSYVLQRWASDQAEQAQDMVSRVARDLLR